MRFLTFLLIIVLQPGTSVASTELTAANQQIRNYDWLTNGRKSGALVLTVDFDKQTRITKFEFNDRGRGPSLLAKAHIGEKERVMELVISGHSYMGAPVDENFISTCESARWSSPLEEGSSSETNSFYLANDGTPEQTAQLARALLATPEGKLDLLPNGRASISKLSSLEISAGPGQFTIDLYAISGAQMNPQFIWLDEHLELFGLSAGSNALVPEGLGFAARKIKLAQEAEEARFYRQRSTPLTRKLPPVYSVSNVNVVNVGLGFILPLRTVIVKNGVIHKILGRANVPPTDMFRVDGNGGWLIPGLWDMHTHNRLPGGLLHIAGGVTTVRDLGNNPDNYLKVSKSFDSGEVIGPRSYAAGIIEGKSPYSAPIDDLAESEADAVALVRKYAALGYPQIKIYSSTSPEWVPAVAAEAHRNNMRVSGHIPAFMNAEQAIRDGYDEIQHIYMLYLNFLASETDDTRTPLRFTLIAEKATELDMESEVFNAFLDLLKSRDITVDPTVAIVDNMLRHRSGTLSHSFAK